VSLVVRVGPERMAARKNLDQIYQKQSSTLQGKL